MEAPARTNQVVAAQVHRSHCTSQGYRNKVGSLIIHLKTNKSHAAEIRSVLTTNLHLAYNLRRSGPEICPSIICFLQYSRNQGTILMCD